MYRIFILLLLTTSVSFSYQSMPLQWSSYIGGASNDEIISIKIDSDENIYMVGHTVSKNYPVSQNAYQKYNRGNYDIFITKIDKNMNVVWSTFFGGSGREFARDFEITDEFIWVGGETLSNDFPTTPDAIDNTFNGGSGDIIISKFSLDGELIYSTFCGGEDYDAAADLTIDKNGSVWITGRSSSTTFQTTNDAFRKSNSGGTDSYLLKISDKGKLEYGTFLGGSSSDFGLTIDYSEVLEKITVVGFTESQDFPITKNALQSSKFGGQNSYDNTITTFNLKGELVWSSFFGGNGNDSPLDLKYDKSGNMYINTYTTSSNLITTNESSQKQFAGKIDNYIFKLNLKNEIEWSTYLGGSGDDGANDINHKYGDMFIDNLNNVNVFGYTNSLDFPTTPNSMFTKMGNSFDNFITKYNSKGKLVLSTYFGGSQDEQSRSIAVTDDKIYVAGWTESNDFPTTGNALNKNALGNRDGFLSIFGNDDVTCNEVYNSDNGFNNSVIKSNRKIDKSSFVRLTGTSEFDLGYMFHRNPINLLSGFETEFSFIISEGKEDLSQPLKDNQTMADSSLPGADGVVLIIAGAIPTTNGERGGGIGYAGFTNAVALEIDLFENSNYNDPNGNHFAIQIPGENGQLSARHNSETTLLMNDSIVEITSDSSQTYFCRVEYRNNTLTVFLDKTNNFKNPIAVLNNFDISKYLKMDMKSNGFLGLTSATGKSVEIHDITHWDICSYQKALLSSIEDKNESYGFYIYPNPTDDELHLQLPRGLANSVKITLTDLLGRTVISKIISAGSSEATLNLNGLSKGLYNITISDDNETLYNSKVIKK